MKKKITYLSLEGITSTVFSSQVYELLNSKITEKNEVTLVLLQPLNARLNKSNLKKLINLKKNTKFKVSIIPYIAFKNKFSLLNAFIFMIIFKMNYCFEKNERIFHCRGQEATYLAIKLKKVFTNIKILSDIRGIPSDELKGINDRRSKYFENIDKKIFVDNKQNVSWFNFVSEVLKQYYSYSDINCSVIPCFSKLKGSRNKECKDSINVIYVGGQQYYQNIDKIPKVLDKLKKPNIRLTLCLNGNKNSVLEEKIRRSNYNCEFKYNLSQDELDEIYSRSNIGIIIRENKLLNMVASPVKISEYLSKGLYLIMVGKIGDFYNDISNDIRLGVTFSDIDNITDFSIDEVYINNEFNTRISYSNRFSKEKCVDDYKKVYELL